MELSESRPTNGQWRAMFATMFGNILEIYDFVAYGIFAVPISKTFFPAGNDLFALILTLVTFAVGFLARPIGALVIGRYADRVGRKKALSLTLNMMGLGTLVMVATPSYAAIGFAAPCIILMGRLLQGFSAGGEIGSAITFAIESVPKHRRAFASSIQKAAQGAGVLLTALVGLSLSSIFTDAQINAWAWRLVFVVGLLIVPVGLYIRRSLPETFHAGTRGRETGLLSQLGKFKGLVAYGVLVEIFATVSAYVANYFTTYATHELHMPLAKGYVGQIAFSLTVMIATPISGIIADRFGYRRIMLIGAVATAMFIYPLIAYLNANPTVHALIGVRVAIAIMSSLYGACTGLALASIFPEDFRATGTGLAYSIGVTFFGGFTPAIVATLIGFTGNKLIIGYYAMAAALISSTALVLGARRNRTASAERAYGAR